MWKGQNGVFKAYASVNIHGRGLVPDDIKSALARDPSHASTNEDYGAWSYSSRGHVDDLAPLESHLTFLLDVFENKAVQLQKLKTHFALRASCYFASQSDLGGFKISSTVLRRLGELGLDFDVDEYFCLGE